MIEQSHGQLLIINHCDTNYFIPKSQDVTKTIPVYIKRMYRYNVIKLVNPKNEYQIIR